MASTPRRAGLAGEVVLRLRGLNLGRLRFVSGEVRLAGLAEEARGAAREAVLRELRAGPRDLREMSRLTGFADGDLAPLLDGMEAEGRVAVFPSRAPEGWRSLYALPPHASRAAERSGFERRPEVPAPLREAILEGVDRLRRRLMRNPDVEEVAREMARDPEEPAFRQAVYQAAGEAGWRPPTPREREEARRKVDYIPTLAGLLKNGVTPSDATLEEIRRAREYLEERTRLLAEA